MEKDVVEIHISVNDFIIYEFVVIVKIQNLQKMKVKMKSTLSKCQGYLTCT